MTLHQKILQKINMLFLWGINFELCYRKLIRSSLRFGMFLMGLVLMGLEWICFFLRFSVVFAFCLCFCALSFFFGCFGFVFCLFSFFPLIFVFFPLFRCFFLFFASSFLFIHFKRFECFLHISRQKLSIVPQSSATGKLPKPEKKRNFAPTPSIRTLSETFQATLLFKTQTQWRKLWADQWYERGSH